MGNKKCFFSGIPVQTTFIFKSISDSCVFRSLRPSGHLSSPWCASPLWSLHASFSSRRQNCGGAAKAYTTSGTPTPPGHQLPGSHRGHRRSVAGHQQHHRGEDPGVYALVQRSTRSLTCGCSSASCCTVSTYEKDGQVSASSPNLNSGVGYGVPTEAYSAPSLTSGLSRGGMRVIHPNELAKKLTHCPLGHPLGPVPVIIDCRPFMEFNKSHIRGAVHINCSDKISRRRLQQGKITVLDLISCRQSKDFLQGDFFPKSWWCTTKARWTRAGWRRLSLCMWFWSRCGGKERTPSFLKVGLLLRVKLWKWMGLQSIECFFFQRLESSKKKETF